MSAETGAALLLAFVGLYPVGTAALWIAGGLLFRVLDQTGGPLAPPP